MNALAVVLLGMGMLGSVGVDGTSTEQNPARLREMLHDRQNGRVQSQAALLLVQSRSRDADAIVRQGLRQSESPEIFSALAGALQVQRDARFLHELLAGITSSRVQIRQAAAEALSFMPGNDVTTGLKEIIEDSRADSTVRVSAITVLGKLGTKPAVALLFDILADESELLQTASEDALETLTGITQGDTREALRAWWVEHKDVSAERWLEERLLFQRTRARRLESDLDRVRNHLVRVEQQLYARLPVGDRLAHLQTLSEHDEAVLRGLTVGWLVEYLAANDSRGDRVPSDILLRLSADGNLEIQRNASLALGKIHDPRVLDRLKTLVAQGAPAVRAAAVRALAQQARLPGPESSVRQTAVAPLLQKALDDSALEVVVEAAEGLGTLGVPEAGPILAALLRHCSESVRQAAAQALERVADTSVLDCMFSSLDDSAGSVRFSLIGAIGKVVGDGRGLNDKQKTTVEAKLKEILQKDVDPGVRSRAAVVLGDCGSQSVLPVLIGRLIPGEDGRVQEKAWGAFVEIVVRSGNDDLLREWQEKLVQLNQKPRVLQLYTEVWLRRQKGDDPGNKRLPLQEELIRLQLEQGKWASALPLIRDLLAKTTSEAELESRLQLLHDAARQALKDGDRPESLRILQEAQPFLMRCKKWSEAFAKLEKEAHGTVVP